jgi:hypothetical protein
MFSLYSCVYPTGVYTGKGNKNRYLCVLPTRKADKISDEKNRECTWLCFIQTIDGGDNLYVRIDSSFPYKTTTSFIRTDHDEICLTKNKYSCLKNSFK